MERPTLEELRDRILKDTAFHGGELPHVVAVAWYGYIGALSEWGLLSQESHSRLVQMLPPITDNPVVDILLGRDDEPTGTESSEDI